MKAFLNILTVSFLCLVLAGCWYDSSWNQKITIVVETPDGVKTGSAITRVERESNFFIYTFFKDGSPEKYIYNVYGEAAFVDLGKGKYLFALINERQYAKLRENLIDKKKSSAFDDLNNPISIPANLYPILISFDDVTNPDSVELVTEDNYDTLSITYEITNELPAYGLVAKVLPCFRENIRCIPFKKSLGPGDPIRDIHNNRFGRAK